VRGQQPQPAAGRCGQPQQQRHSPASAHMEWDHHGQEEQQCPQEPEAAAAEAVRQPLRCGLLLQLPGDLEQAFWGDPHTLR
jgi:hypothetical protein